MEFTTEQQAVIDCQDTTLAVNAFAGTGKTSTLIGYAQARPSKRILYLAFNASVAAEARTKFPPNVDCRTSHSIAYATFGARYRAKLGNPRAKDAIEYLETKLTPEQIGDDRYFFAQSALRAVNTFCANKTTDGKIYESESAVINPATRIPLDTKNLAEAANLLWSAMKDLKNTAIAMPHDGYLKLFQLTKPDLSKYDIILLDEAQDTNPCVLSFVKDQSAGKVFVGDMHQNIYGFRGAINAMSDLKGTELSLTTSFRFGPDVANVANAILSTFCGEKQVIKGLNNDTSESQSLCFLHRTNAGLFGKAIDLLTAKQKLHFIGGVFNYNFEAINDVWKLYSKQSGIKDSFIKRFKSFSDFADYAESADDGEIKSRIKIVDRYKENIPMWVDRINNSDTPSNDANAFLTTAHKSKGLEWDCVILGDDFPPMMSEDGLVPRTKAFLGQREETPLEIGEANLIYVASTRAKKELIPFQDMQYFLDFVENNDFADAEENYE